MHRLKRAAIAVSLSLVSIAFLLSLWRDDLRAQKDKWLGLNIEPVSNSNLTSLYDIFQTDTEQEHAFNPIDDLIETSHAAQAALLAKQTHNLHDAAAAYRKRRGRHPPPHFDKWVQYAQEHNCLIIEDFFDQVYRDLDPFWAFPAHQLRQNSAEAPFFIKVRNGQVNSSVSVHTFVKSYFKVMQEIQHLLPDVDMPINEMDESRILAPWEKINEYMNRVNENKSIPQGPLTTTYPSMPEPTAERRPYPFIDKRPFWNMAREGCPPETGAKTADLDSDFSTPPIFPKTWPDHTYQGFVSNWTIAKDPCYHAHLRNLHGTFVEPISVSTSTELVPIFGGSKLPMNNDILLPAAVYVDTDPRFSDSLSKLEWHEMHDKVLWRGVASGGRNTIKNWTRFQRHRMISMLNGTQVQMTMHPAATREMDVEGVVEEKEVYMPHNFPMPEQALYPLQSMKDEQLPAWLNMLSDASFIGLNCFPDQPGFECHYTKEWYSFHGEMTLPQMFEAKFLPDIDGNSFSGRYRAFLLSNSLPIKATIYSEWHDDRLVPWKHFVPMDNTFVDLYAILEFFVQKQDKAESIASAGRDWANKVLRKEDMLLYIYRVVLEYARICSDERDSMGWNGDL